EHKIHFFIHVRIGAPADMLLNLAGEIGAHLIIMGSHGRTGLTRLLMGSVSERVVREAKCPVLVVREREYQDVELVTVTRAPESSTGESQYVAPHRYSYFNRLMERQKSSWPWY
ncbi:MAG: universal stress protein, partial [Myxococcota bacterium]